MQLKDCSSAAGIDRADLILNAFEGRSRLTLAEISRRTGVPRSSVHRMLERLVNLGWLSRTGHDYRLGLRLIELGALAVAQDRLHETAMPHLRELRRLTDLTVHLAILDGPDVVYLEKLEGSTGPDVGTRAGCRRSAATTSVGKVLTAYCGSARGDSTPAALDRQGPADTVMRREQARIRLHGVAFDRGETMPRVGCIGAPVGTKHDVVGAISICGRVDDITLDSKTIGALRVAGVQIYQKLGRRRLAM